MVQNIFWSILFWSPDKTKNVYVESRWKKNKILVFFLTWAIYRNSLYTLLSCFVCVWKRLHQTLRTVTGKQEGKLQRGTGGRWVIAEVVEFEFRKVYCDFWKKCGKEKRKKRMFGQVVFQDKKQYILRFIFGSFFIFAMTKQLSLQTCTNCK